MKESLNIAILGATGYTGIELVKILSKHPYVKIKHLCARSSIGKSIQNFDQNIKKKKLPKIVNYKKLNWNDVDILFTALPNGEAQSVVKNLKQKIKIIDLSADFRLKKPSEYKKWYGKNHKCKSLIKNSVYSISEFTKKKLKKYNIIACAGCYPTSVQLPLIPLIKNKMIKLGNIIVDSKSGLSGAGKNLNKKFKFTNIYNSVNAYNVGYHRHMAEIDQELSGYSNKQIKISFTPHLIPMFRGILSTIYLELNKNTSPLKVYKLLKKYHKNNFFVKIAKFNSDIGTGDVINTNFCKISVCKTRSNNKIIILTSIDNLVKGAAGQAVQNMNIAFGFKENTGLV